MKKCNWVSLFPLRLLGFTLLVGLTTMQQGAASLIVSFDLGNGATYEGDGPANPGESVLWTKAPGPGEGPFTDADSGVGVRVFNGSGYINTTSSGVLGLFNDFVFDSSGPSGSADWQVSGLNDLLSYDLYFIAPNGQQFAASNVYGGVYVSGSESAGATGATNVFTAWEEGVNYAVLRNLSPTSGVIAGNYLSNPASTNPNNYGIAGVQVVAIPESNTFGLLGLGMCGLLWHRVRR